MIRHYAVDNEGDISLSRKRPSGDLELFICSDERPEPPTKSNLTVLILDDGVPQALQADASTVSNPDREIIRSAIVVSLNSGASQVVCANLSQRRADDSIAFLRKQKIETYRTFVLVDQVVDVGSHEVPAGLSLLERLVKHGIPPSNIAVFSKVEAFSDSSGFRYIAKPVVRSISSNSMAPLPNLKERLTHDLRSWIVTGTDNITRTAIRFIDLPEKFGAPWFSPSVRAHNKGEPNFEAHREAASKIIRGLTPDQYKRLLSSSDPLGATEPVARSRNSLVNYRTFQKVLNQLLKPQSIEFQENGEADFPVYLPSRPGFSFILALAEFLRVAAVESYRPIPITLRRPSTAQQNEKYASLEVKLELNRDTYNSLIFSQDSDDAGDLGRALNSLKKAHFQLPSPASSKASLLLQGCQNPVVRFGFYEKRLSFIWRS